ncbi:MAG: hypothetical protein IPN24_11355 [Betaproteobacteria bacterium]|nr:hypothetical protein [Betaproteobacteria bacterium]
MATVPWAALAAIAIPLIMDLFSEGPAMRSGTFASGAASQGGNPLFSGESAFGEFGVVNDKWFSDSDMGAEMGAFMDGIAGIDNALASIIGKDLTGQVAEALASVTTEFEAGIEGEAVTFGSIMKERYIAVFDVLDVRLGTVVEGFEGTAEELAQFLVVLADVYMMTEKLPDDVGNTLLDVLAAGILTVEEIGRFATAYVGLQNVLAIDPVALVLDQMSAANATAYDKVLTLRGGLDTLLESYDGSVAGTEQLYDATMQYVQAQVYALAEIQNMRGALSDMFGEAHDTLEQFFWTNTQKADKLQADAVEYTRLLNDTLDPKLIQEQQADQRRPDGRLPIAVAGGAKAAAGVVPAAHRRGRRAGAGAAGRQHRSHHRGRGKSNLDHVLDPRRPERGSGQHGGGGSGDEPRGRQARRCRRHCAASGAHAGRCQRRSDGVRRVHRPAGRRISDEHLRRPIHRVAGRRAQHALPAGGHRVSLGGRHHRPRLPVHAPVHHRAVGHAGQHSVPQCRPQHPAFHAADVGRAGGVHDAQHRQHRRG